MSIIVTGGAGFIGSNFVLDWLSVQDEAVTTLDKLTYAGNLENLASLAGDSRHSFIHGDIGDSRLVGDVLARHQPRAIINFAAESHVDRSIHAPAAFIQTNVVGTFQLLESVREYWSALQEPARSNFRLCTCRLMKSTARWTLTPLHSRRLPPMRPIAHMRPARQQATTSCEPTTILMACRY